MTATPFITTARRRALFLLVLGLSACATRVESSRRVGELGTPAPGFAFVWSAAKPPSFNNLPALGAAIPGADAAGYTANYAAEFAEFGAALKRRLDAEPALQPTRTTVLLASHTPAELTSALRVAGPTVPVVEMHPERVTSYSTPGCYAFKVRVSLRSAVPRKLVWTALIDLPPKTRHTDPFDPLAADFVATLVKQMRSEGLLS